VSEKQKIVAVMPVRNESGRYLRDVLTHLTRWVDTIVVLDDASDDDTAGLAASFSRVVCYQNDVAEYRKDESKLRAKLWQLSLRENPDWILALDADQIFEDRIINEIGLLIRQHDFDVICFRVFDFWKSYTHYRIDGDWNPWKNFLPFIVRYQPGIETSGFEQESAFKRFPSSFKDVYSFYSDIRVKHLGWAREEEHHLRCLRRREIDLKTSGEESARTRDIAAPDSKMLLEEWMPSKQLYFLES
jgi:glycosyltransferase involved in cell wall biosynthesis